MVEGRLRCKELSEYLEKLNAPKSVWLAEDASGIITKVSYDSTTNQMVGVVLPTNENTGMPVPFPYVPSNINEIEAYLKLPKASSVYAIIAQPIKENVPPFVLQIYGIDNTFTSTEVMKRWRHTKKELKK